MSTFYENPIKIKLEMIENQREAKNPSTGKFRQPPNILPFFALFRPKMDQKRAQSGFLESWEPELMS